MISVIHIDTAPYIYVHVIHIHIIDVCMYIHMMYIQIKDIAKIKCGSSRVATTSRLPLASGPFLPKSLTETGLLFERDLTIYAAPC